MAKLNIPIRDIMKKKFKFRYLLILIAILVLLIDAFFHFLRS